MTSLFKLFTISYLSIFASLSHFFSFISVFFVQWYSWLSTMFVYLRNSFESCDFWERMHITGSVVFFFLSSSLCFFFSAVLFYFIVTICSRYDSIYIYKNIYTYILVLIGNMQIIYLCRSYWIFYFFPLLISLLTCSLHTVFDPKFIINII